VRYDDLDYLLKELVLPVGRSEHRPALKSMPTTGTRLKYGNPNPSRLEGNRVMFHFIRSKSEKQFVKDVRDNLLNLPSQIAISRLSKREQLAYWLNLHNSIFLAEMADRYPITKVSRLFNDCTHRKERKRGFACKRLFTFMNHKISLDDIRNHILKNWQDPLVIYGFYMGAVGTPNIRLEAFTGTKVYKQLEENAIDFINSVRGTRMHNNGRLRVSRYYVMMAAMFPDFQPDLIRHLEQHARGTFKIDVQTANTIDPGIDDWYIADLFNGKRVTTANLRTTSRYSRKSKFKYPQHVQELLRGVIERYRRRKATVWVEPVTNVGPLTPQPETTAENVSNNGPNPSPTPN
jgi:hypothetical protein